MSLEESLEHNELNVFFDTIFTDTWHDNQKFAQVVVESFNPISSIMYVG